MSGKKKVAVTQKYDGTTPTYVVVKTINTTDPKVGETLSEQNIKDLIQTSHEITITG